MALRMNSQKVNSVPANYEIIMIALNVLSNISAKRLSGCKVCVQFDTSPGNYLKVSLKTYLSLPPRTRDLLHLAHIA